MASLTTLPPEILSPILADVLLTGRDAPNCPWESQDRRRLAWRSGRWRDKTGVWVKPQGPPNPALPLLLVNRLINQHIQAITAAETSLRNYALDVMFVKLAGIWPTWTRVPVLTNHVDTVHTTFRIFNPPLALDPKFNGSGVLGTGCGGMHKGVWNFYYLLTSFLQYGPLARSVADQKEAASRYTIRNLVIDIPAPPEGEDHTVTGAGYVRVDGQRQIGETFSLHSHEGWQTPPGLEPRVHPAEKLAIFIHGWVVPFLELSYTSDETFILLESILDSVEFRVDGETRCRIDVEATFREAKPRNWSETRADSQRERFRLWKEWVTEKRRLARLGRDMPAERPHQTIFYF